MKAILSIVFWLCLAAPALAEDTTARAPEGAGMNNQSLQALIEGLADEVEGRPGYWRFVLQDVQASVITDEKADRMRIVVPVARMEEVDGERLKRLMQANFDSALDARYAVAQGVLWSVFLHPLSTLGDHQFIDGVAQAVNLAATYGTTYSSGALIFGGGDSREEQSRYYRAIIERGDAI